MEGKGRSKAEKNSTDYNLYFFTVSVLCVYFHSIGHTFSSLFFLHAYEFISKERDENWLADSRNTNKYILKNELGTKRVHMIFFPADFFIRLLGRFVVGLYLYTIISYIVIMPKTLVQYFNLIYYGHSLQCTCLQEKQVIFDIGSCINKLMPNIKYLIIP